MRKIIIILASLLFCIAITANIMVPEPRLLVSEIFFEGDEWKIEAVVIQGYLPQSDNLDSVILETSSGQSYFKPGIVVAEGEMIMITKDSLITPLSINKSGDFINMKEYTYGTEWIEWDLQWIQNIKFGDYEGSTCSSPNEGQSMVLQQFELILVILVYERFFWLVKENNPTPGSDPFNCSNRDTISGYIYDKNMNPLKGAELRYCNKAGSQGTNPELPQIITDNYGHFDSIMMYSKLYDASVILGDSIILNTTFNVELDSSNTYIFKADNYLVGNKKILDNRHSASLTNYPNPVRDQTTFSITIPENIHFKNAIIKVFNCSGIIVDLIPIAYNNTNIYNVTWNRSNNFPDGNYFYNLDIDYKKVASNRMIFIK